MRQVLALVVSAFAVLSTACAYENPTQPLPTPVDASAPFALTLGTSSNTVTARVQNANGAPLGNIAVRFATNVGSVSPSIVTTSADGKAATTLTAGDTATVTATVGSLSAHSLVAAQGPGSGTPTPPGSTPTPAFLNVSPNGTVGTPVTFTVSSSAPGPWSWSFGDGVNTQTSAFTATHTYGRPGTYAPAVSSSTTNAAGATITITDAPAPATPSYTVALAASPTSVTAGGSATLTATVTPLNGAPAATTFAWDCDATSPTGVHGSSTHVCPYPTAGTITSKVTVAGGTATGSGSTTLTVAAIPVPTLTVNCNTNGKIGGTTPVPTTCTTSATVNGSVVSAGSIGPVDWDFGDGSAVVTSPGNTTPAPGHTYPAALTYTVTARATIAGVTDKVQASTTTTVVVAVPAPPPSITVTLTCTINASGVASPCNVSVVDQTGANVTASVTQVVYDWGDGQVETVLASPLASHTYTQAGTFAIRATVTANGITGSATKTATVS